MNAQKINMEMDDLNNSIKQLDLAGIYRTLYLVVTENTFWCLFRLTTC